MSVFRINTMSSAAAGGSDTLTLKSAPSGHRYTHAVLRVNYPVTSGSAYAQTATAANMLAAATAMFQSLNLAYGANSQRTILPTVGGTDLRDIHRYCTQQEVPNGFAAIGVSSTTILTFDLVVPLGGPRFMKDGKRRGLGWTQVRKLRFDWVEGAALSIGSSNNTLVRAAGNCKIDVDLYGYPTQDDNWAPPMSFWRGNSATLEAYGPDGLHVAMWDVNAAYASSAFVLVSIEVGGQPIATAVPIYLAEDEYELGYLRPGAADITDHVTVMLSMTDGQDSSELPAGPIVFKQASQYVNQLQLRGLFFPSMDSSEGQEATVEGANGKNEPVVASTDGFFNDPSTSDGAARSNPITLRPVSDPVSLLTPGMLANPGASGATVNIPAHVETALGSAVSNASSTGGATATAAATGATKAVIRMVPGGMKAALGGIVGAKLVSPAQMSAAVGAMGAQNGTGAQQSLARIALAGK